MIGNLNVKYQDLVQFCDQHSYKIIPSQLNSSLQLNITGVEPIDAASENDLSFCRFDDDKGMEWIKNSNAGFVFIPEKLGNVKTLKFSTTYVCVKHPRLALLKFIEKFWVPEKNTIDQDFDVHPTAKIGRNVKIGKFCVIGAHVEIGDFCSIGNNTTIEHAKIGQKCTIGSSVTIGGEGFGFEDENGEVLNFPHLGGVIIGDEVSIGSSSCLDRASLGNTVIEDRVKIDNLVHIAHNVRVGRGSKIIAMSIIGGSSKIGQNSWIAPGASVRDWVDIGDHVIVGLGAVVTKDIPNNTAVVGNPAKPIEKTKNRYR